MDNKLIEAHDEDVNLYIGDCGELRLHCVTDCLWTMPWITDAN